MVYNDKMIMLISMITILSTHEMKLEYMMP